jgi:hypothetical protein
MTPENWLRSLCVRHGLPPEYGRTLLPVVRRAMEAPDELRARLLSLIETDLAQRAGHPRPMPEPVASESERRVLSAVARMLHGWTPSQPMLDLGDRLGDLPR